MLHDRTPGGLRQHVRSALAVDHDRVDAKFAELDIQTRAGLVVFLQTHRAAFEAMLHSGAAFDKRIKETHLTDIIKALETDLKALRAPVLRVNAPKEPYASLAIQVADVARPPSQAGTGLFCATSDDRRMARALHAFVVARSG